MQKVTTYQDVGINLGELITQELNKQGLINGDTLLKIDVSCENHSSIEWIIQILTIEHAKIIKKFVNPVAMAMYFLSAALWAPIIVFCCDRPNAKPVHCNM